MGDVDETNGLDQAAVGPRTLSLNDGQDGPNGRICPFKAYEKIYWVHKRLSEKAGQHLIIFRPRFFT